MKHDRYMDLARIDAQGMVFLNPLQEGPFELEGFEFVRQDHCYRRFPVNPVPALPEGVEYESWHTAGGILRFRSDTPRVILRVKLFEGGIMDHMPNTGRSCFDLYFGTGTNLLYYNTGRAEIKDQAYETTIFETPNQDRIMRDFNLHFPLYNGVTSLEVGIMADSELEAPQPRNNAEKIVFYGTSITQGGCANRPGMAFTNILARKLDRTVLNFGFSGCGKGEIAVAEHLGRIPDISLYVLDYVANVTPDGMRATLNPFIDRLREYHPQVKILLLTKIKYAKEAGDTVEAATMRHERDEFYQILFNEYQTRRAAGDTDIFFADAAGFLGDDYYECTVDGVHPTDLGFYRMAQSLLPIVEDILQK